MNKKMPNLILDPNVHARLIADAAHICEVAGVQQRYLGESMKSFCDVGEVDWVLNFKRYEAQGIPGLLIDGLVNPIVRCQAIAAALLRNFTDARVMPLNAVTELVRSDDMPVPHVLLIPNFHVSVGGESPVAWKTSLIFDLLLQRAALNKPTVLYVQNWKKMTTEYGPAITSFLATFKHAPQTT